ncbi:TetR family transcriptional regulator [Novosphingobium sp. FSY-8]|uniref:TetR family transcriptional regulator n=1 Tax=Novosphingobium ovatum TaxID=1908523 RepID=A0ABW9XAW3_9SPHN|nr:TetR family transcriptional regulator [Novosphingobium ovatum]NBC35647.1 TetR family transcriptional regulator [Novosphingobium ovatum]
MDATPPADTAPVDVTPNTAAHTRHRLLLAAERLVVGEGVHALSVRRIANAAQVNSALIRYHFGGTDGLLRDLALRNAARIADARLALLEDAAGFDAAVDALVLPLWTEAAMSPEYRAIVVLDEMFSRAAPGLHREIWAVFADGVARVGAALAACLPDVEPETLNWRIRFVTAAALDIPPRSTRMGEGGQDGDAERLASRRADRGERLAQFRRFAAHALRG